MISLLFAALLQLGPYTMSGNFPRDLAGPVDTRMAGQVCASGPCIWGTADSDVLPIQFKPPAGYRVRILRLRGDMVAWPRVLPGEVPVAPGQYAGVLMGFQTTAPEGSAKCDWGADNTMLYIQDAVGTEPRRAPFDYRDVNVLLEPDSILRLVIASWLNTTGRAIHIEATYTVVYRFEKEK
jgi:hypothetical protein